MRLVSVLAVALIAVFVLVATTAASDSSISAADTNRLFQSFVKSFKRVYPANLITSRLASFRANLDRITAFQTLKKQLGNAVKHTVGVTKFADLSPEEFRDIFLKYQVESSPVRGSSFIEEDLSSETGALAEYEEAAAAHAGLADAFDENLDWSTRFIFPLIRHQGYCGSCYAFATAATIEAARSIAHMPNITVAVEPFVDCAGSGCYGCTGGRASCAFDFAKNKGYFTEQTHPYTRANEKAGIISTVKQTAIGLFCSRMHSSKPAGRISGYKSVTPRDLNAYVTAIKRTPLFSVIDATPLQLYSSGIVTAAGTNCTTKVNHAMVAVGYGTQAGTRFLTFRNSWGFDWGEQGYVRVEAGNTCGVLQEAYYPVLA